jgi:hypothetical protein
VGKGAKKQGNRRAKAVNEEDDDEDNEGVELLSATGLTESGSSSSSNGSDSEDAFDPSSDDEDEVIEDAEGEEREVDSDFLDGESDVGAKTKKRKSIAGGEGGRAVAGGGSSAKRTKVVKGENGDGEMKKVNGGHGIEGYEDEDADLSDIELEEGQELAGRIYPAPKTGQGRSIILRSTLDSLLKLVRSCAWTDIAQHLQLSQESADT